MQPQGKEGGGRKGSGLAPDRLLRIAGEGKGRALSQDCFIGSCGCVCIKKVATTDTLHKYLMGGAVPWQGMLSPMPSATSQPESNATRPIGLVVPGNASALQHAGK